MARFTYQAVRQDGEATEGELEAPDAGAVIRQLQGQGLIPLKIRPAGGLSDRLRQGRVRPLTAKEIAVLTRELSTLLESGLTLDRSLQILIDLSPEERIVRVMTSLQRRVRGGSTFAAALEEQGGQFPRLYVNMVRAGEASGTLEVVLGRLADYLERTAELRETITSALIYPLILLVVAGLSVIMLLVFVVPQFSVLFADMGAALPVPTRIVIAVGDLFRDYWWALLAVVALIALAVERRLQDPAVRTRLDRRLLALPLFGDLIWKLETARFCHTLSTLLKNGLPLLSALNLSKEVVSNRKLSGLLDEVGEDLKHGRGLAEPVAQREILPQLALQMIRVGEESGHLDAMLAKVGEIYDKEVQASVKRLLTLLEPVLIVGLGILVAGIIISIIVPILGANELVI
ncbi:type II secretion system F family protein [Candidatus Thiosymbion oneisti]|uniref:type II secretion system F family protein n=1 Tax=Candidatus Thiosymbion oneisti TaxID=589554 RepID=UPI000AEFBA2A|nr:type II secretion system F family protein [Candidatus Thiosymbion oneisti]